MNPDTETRLPETAVYPIREISRLTGVNPVTLRAWQRRYGLLKPARTASGHRLYSAQDVERIRHILRWLEKGISIGKVRALLDHDTAGNDTEMASGRNNRSDNWQRCIDSLAEAAVALNLSRAEQEVRELSTLYPAELLLRRIIEPWLSHLNQLTRPDRPAIECAVHGLLAQLFARLVTIQSGRKIGVIHAGNISPLQLRLLQYELQGLELRSLDLGAPEPSQLPLIDERLKQPVLLVLLGSGLNASWFKSNEKYWNERTFFVGEIGKIYQQQSWLSRPFAPTVSELSRLQWEGMS